MDTEGDVSMLMSVVTFLCQFCLIVSQNSNVFDIFLNILVHQSRIDGSPAAPNNAPACHMLCSDGLGHHELVCELAIAASPVWFIGRGWLLCADGKMSPLSSSSPGAGIPDLLRLHSWLQD